MLDCDVSDLGPACRMVQRAGRTDFPGRHNEIHVVAAQRVEIGRVVTMGNQHAAGN
ncbi:hypothetical protein D3C83_76260 [compost metagenome]